MIEEIYKVYSKSWKVTTDSRKVPEGSVFFALKGDKFDGNAFAQLALQNGAALAVIDNPDYLRKGCVLVEDALETLQQLALYHRRKLNAIILAITGSNGKTTTKELIHAVLSKKYNTHATVGNLNNHIGVPLTLLSLTPHAEVAIVEMGANRPGDIEQLCRIAEPDMGLITNIGRAHLGGFGSFDGVKATKGELYNYLISFNKTIFYNQQNAILTEMLQNHDAQLLISYSQYAHSFSVIESSQSPFLSLSIQENNLVTNLQTNLVGNYNAENVIAAYAVGRHFNVSIDLVREAIESYIPTNNRSQLIQTSRNAVIMDAYNANPSSMEQALSNFDQLNALNKVAILGEMLELGEYASDEHNKIVDLALSFNFSEIILVGKGYENITKAGVIYFDNVDSCMDYLKNKPLTGSTILLKGSRVVRLERLLDVL